MDVLCYAASQPPGATHLTPHSELQPQFNLKCCVLGDDTSHIKFQIKIAGRETVGAFKKPIRAEKTHAFKHVDADTLVLWKASIPVDQGRTEKLLELDFVNERPLLPMSRLSKVFSDQPEDEHLHIVVRAPPAGGLKRFIHPIFSCC